MPASMNISVARQPGTSRWRSAGRIAHSARNRPNTPMARPVVGQRRSPLDLVCFGHQAGDAHQRQHPHREDREGDLPPIHTGIWISIVVSCCSRASRPSPMISRQVKTPATTAECRVPPRRRETGSVAARSPWETQLPGWCLSYDSRGSRGRCRSHTYPSRPARNRPRSGRPNR